MEMRSKQKELCLNSGRGYWERSRTTVVIVGRQDKLLCVRCYVCARSGHFDNLVRELSDTIKSSFILMSDVRITMKPTFRARQASQKPIVTCLNSDTVILCNSSKWITSSF